MTGATLIYRNKNEEEVARVLFDDHDCPWLVHQVQSRAQLQAQIRRAA